MRSRIINYAMCHRWIILTTAAGCIGSLMLIGSWPRLRRLYAAEMMVRAVEADEADLEGSQLLSSALERVSYFEAQDETVARLTPLLDPTNEHLCMRARYCILVLNAHSPAAINALIAIYLNPLAPTHTRFDTAGILLLLAPQRAEECGAAATWRQFIARHQDDLLGGEGGKHDEDLLPGYAGPAEAK